MTTRVCFRRFAGLAAISAAVLMGIQDIAAQQLEEFEEIVVTARKRSESVLEIPLSVSAFTQDDLDSLGMNTIEQLSSVTTGFAFQNVSQGGMGGRHNPNIRFRGLGVQVESPASRAGSVFWNGGYISDGAGILPLIDLERVEVLKGPQTAFFGRNTFAGAVNYIPARPGDEFSGKASLSYSASDESSHNFTAAVGGPITDQVGVRLALMQEKVGADWMFDNGDPIGEQNNTAITGLMTFELSDSLGFEISAFYVDSDDSMQLQSHLAPVAAGSCNRSYNGTIRPVDGSPGSNFTTDLSQSSRNLFCGSIPDWDAVEPGLSEVGKITGSTPLFQFSNPWSFVTNLPPELEGYGIVGPPDGLGNTYELWRVDASGEYELANGGVLSAQFARGESSSWRIIDNNFGMPAAFFFANSGGPWLAGQAGWVRDTYIEARYTPAAGDRMNYMVGASYYSQDNRQTDFSSFGATNNLNFQDGENFGVFGALDYALNDQWTLSLEGRWNTDTQTIVYDGVSIAQRVDPTALVNVEQEYSAFMPRVIISWQPSEDTNFYAHYSRSNLQGNDTNAEDYSAATGVGLNIGVFTPKQALDAFEAGLKQRALGGRLNYAVSAYFMDWENQTFFELSPAPFFTPAYIAGDAEISGLEVEFDLLLSEWLNVSGGITYNDVEFTDFAGTGSVATAVLAPPPTLSVGEQISATGGRPRYMPEWTGSLSAVLQLDPLTGLSNNLWLRVDGIYQGQFYIDNFNYNSVDSYWKINVRLHADLTDMFAVELYARNLTNDLSYLTAGGTTSIFGLPHRKTFAPLPQKREVGLKLLTTF